MFRLLRELFSSDNLLEECFNATADMLREDFVMFEESTRTLRHSDSDELQFDIYKADKKINKYEREVRRKVLAHLTVSRPTDVGPGLVLISVVGNVERIGDYTKNITELATAHPNRLHGFKFEDELAEVELKLTDRFKKVTEAFASSNEELARQIMEGHRDIASWCDTTVNEIIIGPTEGLHTGHAVVLALYIRFLKRIWAHLTNISSSIVNPFPRIGYRMKDSDMPPGNKSDDKKE